jgi:hypothetical protein
MCFHARSGSWRNTRRAASRLAEPLQLDLHKSDLLVDQAPEGVKLARTHVVQMEALKRYRTGGEQRSRSNMFL